MRELGPPFVIAPNGDPIRVTGVWDDVLHDALTVRLRCPRCATTERILVSRTAIEDSLAPIALWHVLDAVDQHRCERVVNHDPGDEDRRDVECI